MQFLKNLKALLCFFFHGGVSTTQLPSIEALQNTHKVSNRLFLVYAMWKGWGVGGWGTFCGGSRLLAWGALELRMKMCVFALKITLFRSDQNKSLLIPYHGHI